MSWGVWLKVRGEVGVTCMRVEGEEGVCEGEVELRIDICAELVVTPRYTLTPFITHTHTHTHTDQLATIT